MTESGCVVWLTGPPACGKTTVARHVAKRLQGQSVVVLDSDELREALTPSATYADGERDDFYGTLGRIAELLWRSGLTVVIAATASKRAYRDALRERVGDFLEVYLYARDEVLEARDPKGLYERARAGQIDTLPGRGAPYEAPTAADLTFDTEATTPRRIAEAIVERLEVPTDRGAQIEPRHVERYLVSHGHPDAKLVSMTPLGDEVQEGLKAHGYGSPLRVTFEEDDVRHDVTLRTMGDDAFGHDRRADRFDGLVLQYDEFSAYENHIEPIDVGVVAPNGALHSIGEGEPFLLTTFVKGELYAKDLKRLSGADSATGLDRDRARALAEYLARMHAEQRPAKARRRATRDLVGHGEGIFGLVDGYAADDPIATPERLRRIEHDAVDWLWRLRERDDRSRRTHGDFHPFNVLFREGTDFTALDASRGGAGDPADDVTALSINYLFFALAEKKTFDGPLRDVWDTFWLTYLERSRDREVLEMVAPYFTWRALVLACPAWYPDLDPEVRDTILRFAERLIAGESFDPDRVEELLRAPPR